ncbi:hypothetical protein ACGFNU_08010 [Spirillospora sp. NPDC048911]|uniref:hypothetical protein n=1 Tax=Spirillospora sp. NPDC048911 TaxID=3364527 RepID=UPI0037160861
MAIYVPGWHNEQKNRCLVARRLGPLTDYQLLNGCLVEVTAQTDGELWLLCDAQARLAERVAAAEKMRARS